MRDRNARVIIPLAIGAWLLAIVVSRPETPDVLRALFVIAFAVTIPVVVFSLMARSGWSTLAARHRSAAPYAGVWRRYPTAIISDVSVDTPDFRARQFRLFSALRVATTDDALHLSMLFSKVPLLGGMFPELRIPWSAVRTARTYEAPGWYPPQRQPGTLAQAAYDPNYTGTFVELAVGEPPIFLQLPASLLGDTVMARLPRAP